MSRRSYISRIFSLAHTRSTAFFRRHFLFIFSFFFFIFFCSLYTSAGLETRERARLEKDRPRENRGGTRMGEKKREACGPNRTPPRYVCFAAAWTARRFLNKTAVVARRWLIRGNLIVLAGTRTNFPTFPSESEYKHTAARKIISWANCWKCTYIRVYVQTNRTEYGNRGR